MKFYTALRYRCNIIMILEKYHTTMSLQSQYVIDLYRDVNPTKNRCRHDIAYPLGLEMLKHYHYPQRRIQTSQSSKIELFAKIVNG